MANCSRDDLVYEVPNTLFVRRSQFLVQLCQQINIRRWYVGSIYIEENIIDDINMDIWILSIGSKSHQVIIIWMKLYSNGSNMQEFPFCWLVIDKMGSYHPTKFWSYNKSIEDFHRIQQIAFIFEATMMWFCKFSYWSMRKMQQF